MELTQVLVGLGIFLVFFSLFAWAVKRRGRYWRRGRGVAAKSLCPTCGDPLEEDPASHSSRCSTEKSGTEKSGFAGGSR